MLCARDVDMHCGPFVCALLYVQLMCPNLCVCVFGVCVFGECVSDINVVVYVVT